MNVLHMLTGLVIRVVTINPIWPFVFWHKDKSVLTQNRVTCRVPPEAMRLCVKACVRGCVGVLLHATPQLSSAAYFIWWCMQVLHSSATLEVTNTPSPIISMSTQVSLLLLYSISSLYVAIWLREPEQPMEIKYICSITTNITNKT